MSKVINDPAQTEGILQNGSCNNQESVIAREMKVIAPASELGTPSRLWLDIQASRGLDSNGDDRKFFTERVNGVKRKKLPAIGCKSLQTRIKRPLDIDGQPGSGRPESPVFGGYSDLQFADCEITDGNKDRGKISAWGAKIGSVFAVPMGRIDSRKKSVDSRKSAQSGLDALEREWNPSKVQPDLYLDERGISVGGVRSPSPTHTSIEETLHDGQPSPLGETHHLAFQNTRDGGLGSSVRDPHQSPPAQSQSRMRQSFSKYSGKIATWRTSPGRDNYLPSQPLASRKFSLPDPPKDLKSRINRFLRPEQGDGIDDIVPPDASHDEGSNVPLGTSRMATHSTSTDSERPPPTKSGLRGNLTKRINSARKRGSLPFIFGPDVAVVCAPAETLGPQAVPPGPPRRIDVTPSDLPGHSFLAPGTKSVTVSPTPPYLEHNHVTQEWTFQDFRDMNLIQSSPFSDSPGYEDPPPQPPPPETDSTVKSPAPPHAIPIAPGMDVAVPFGPREYIPEVEAGGGTLKLSGVPWDVTTHHENPSLEDPKDRPKPSTGTNGSDVLATLQGISSLLGGKPIELLEEEERRNKRDSRVMGLNPETVPGDERLAGQAGGDSRRDTYGAAIREIAGLDLTLRGPPPPHSSNLGDVSGSSSSVNNFSFPALQLASNDEPVVTFPVPSPFDSSDSEMVAVTGARPYNLFPGPGVSSALSTLTAQFAITPALTAVPTISTSSQQHVLTPRGINNSLVVEGSSSRVYVKVAPQEMVTPLTAGLGGRVPNPPETLPLGSGMDFDGGSLVSVSINGNGNVNVSPYQLDEQVGGEEEEEEEEEGEQGQGRGNEGINIRNVSQKENAG